MGVLRASMVVALIFTDVRAEAATLKGIVIANELGGPPMPNVEISAFGANPKQSLSNGTFVLDFPQKRPGDVVQVIVSKAGHQVVNDIQLELPLPANADTKLLTVILCKLGSREEMARRFYRLKSIEAVEETYSRRLKDLEQGQKATAAQLASLRQERDQARSAAERLAEELAKRESQGASGLYREAMRLFLDGKVDDAIRTLEDEKLRQLVLAAKQTIAEAVRAYLLKADLLTVQFRFAAAEEAYRAAIKAAPDDFQAHFAFAKFSKDLNHFNEARVEYEHSLKLAGSPGETATALNNLGVLHTVQNRMEDARRAYEEALKIRRELAQTNPDTYQPDVAMTLNNLGNLYSDQNRMEDARRAYEEALKICRDLVRLDSDTYQSCVAKTLNNLGILHSAQHRMEDARRAFEETLATYRELAQKDPDTYQPDVAMTLNNLGNLHFVQHRIEDARRSYEEALKIRRELAKKNPDTYQPLVANTLNNLGNVNGVQNRMEDARRAYEEALRIRRELAQKNPDTYQPDVAMTLNNLGVLHSDQKRMEDARRAYEEALKIYRELALKNPDTYQPKVAMTLDNLGELHSDQKRMEDARRAYEEALKIYQRFADRDPDQYRTDVARVKSLLEKLGK